MDGQIEMVEIKLESQERTPQILVVEDNSFNIIAIEAVLDEFGLTDTELAMNGQLAVDKVSSIMGTGMYQLILMDCNMPVMDGFQATQAIREIVDTHNLSHIQQVEQPFIVALTAYSTAGFKDKCLAAGMNKFLTKPINVVKLKKVLTRLQLL